MDQGPAPWVRRYVTAAGTAPRLDRAEAAALAVRAQTGDARAAETLVRSNRRLVVSVARRYARATPAEGDWQTRAVGQPPDLDQLGDLIVLGEEGLHVAIERFDVGRGFAFPSYATWWIRQAILGGDGTGGVGEPRRPSPAPGGSSEALEDAVAATGADGSADEWPARQGGPYTSTE